MTSNKKIIILRPTGGFAEWLHATEVTLRSEIGGAEVPCGTCTACCRSSMFVHIGPDEPETLRRIAPELLFPAPGLPKGHVLMGYNERGHCPMLVDGNCSIYEDRPRTCRDYDCRVLAATGLLSDQEQSDLAQRVQEWAFEYETDDSREKHRLLRETAAFLRERRELFPPGTLPSQPAQLAVPAIIALPVFVEMQSKTTDDASPATDDVIAAAIMRALQSAKNRPDLRGQSKKR